jgi:hypothetical protein
MGEHPGIVFKDGPSGRRAAVAEQRLLGQLTTGTTFVC